MTADQIKAEIRRLGYEPDVEPKFDPFAGCVMAVARATRPGQNDIYASGVSEHSALSGLWSACVGGLPAMPTAKATNSPA